MSEREYLRSAVVVARGELARAKMLEEDARALLADAVVYTANKATVLDALKDKLQAAQPRTP